MSLVDVGRTVFTPQGLKIHRYMENLELTDLTHAGKRGKKVRRALVSVNRLAGGSLAKELVGDATVLCVDRSFDQALDALKKHPLIYDVRIDELRGIDVEPAATKIELTSPPDARGARIEVTASPYEFRVLHSWPLRDKEGKLTTSRQDTFYHSGGKKGAQLFYTWLQSNLSHARGMTMDDFRQLWKAQGIAYDSH